MEGSGHAIITEVAFQSKTISSTAADADCGESDGVKTLKNSLEVLNRDRLHVDDTLKRVKQQRIVLDQFADRIVEQASV